VTAAVLVAVGTLFSAFWILSANSWMQHPAGHYVENGVAYPADWLTAIFNPTFPLRFAHMVTAAYLTTAFVVIATGARHLLAGLKPQHAMTMLKMGLGMAVVLTPLQLVFGDESGRDVLRYQPPKLAAIEGKWDASTEGPVPLVLFAIPDEEGERNRFEIAVPYLGSLIVTRSLEGGFAGLKAFAPEDRPPVVLPFFGFRIMVGLWGIMVLVAFIGAFLWWRGRLETARTYLRLTSWTWPVGFLAILAGWIVAEVGRQPWLATGILRTADAASPVGAGQVATTLVLFVVVYLAIFAAGIVYINRLINKGPTPEAPHPEGVPNRPITAATSAAPGGPTGAEELR
jgi:cytochrome d ubiquinol oxidase subunit I